MANRDVHDDFDLSQADEEDAFSGVARGDSEDEGEDLMDNMEADYRPMDGLDRYEREGLDEDFVDDVTEEERLDARASAERELARRDALEARASGRRRAFPSALDEDDLEDALAERPRRRRRVEEALTSGADEGEAAVDLEEARGPLKEWVCQEPVRAELKRQFTRFLRTWKDESGDAAYRSRLRDMVRSNGSSLEVSYVDLAHALPSLAVWVADVPRQVLPALDECAAELVRAEYPEFAESAAETHVRIAELPLQERLRDLRQHHLGQLVRVAGVVTRRTGVYPQLRRVSYDCGSCGALLGPFVQSGEAEVRVGSCVVCQSKGPFAINASETLYRNYQSITLQESPGDVPAGRLPRTKQVLLLSDLVDCVRPGDEAVVTGVYQHAQEPGANARHGFPVYATSIEAVHVAVAGDDARRGAPKLTDEDVAELLALSRDPRIAERVAASVAPGVWGAAAAKRALALALFGGQHKVVQGGHSLRGDINVLLLGDPGTAKSQLLKCAQRLAPRAVYTTGRGASAVGLTAAVRREPATGEWTLEGGALVLADRGVCLIDEFDKMSDADRVSIHEAMEQQSISISKAGIVAQLRARCSVVAAANPVGGRYDPSKTLADNVELGDPILSRFDVLCVLRDAVDPVADDALARFVVASHARSHPDGAGRGEDGAPAAPPPPQSAPDAGVIPPDTLRKYVAYARATCRPRLAAGDHDKVAAAYGELRREAAAGGGMPMAVRHLESMVRMAEARASMHLRDRVSDGDVDAAVAVMLDSFVGAQKLAVQRALARRLRRFMVAPRDYDALLLFKLRECLRESRRAEALTGKLAGDARSYAVDVAALEQRARELDLHDLGPFFESEAFRQAGFGLSDDAKTILLAR